VHLDIVVFLVIVVGQVFQAIAVIQVFQAIAVIQDIVVTQAIVV